MNSHTSFVRWAQLFAEVWMICGLSNHKMAERWRIRVALCIAKKENDLNAELSRLRGEEQAWKREALNGHEVVQLRDAEVERLTKELQFSMETSSIGMGNIIQLGKEMLAERKAIADEVKELRDMHQVYALADRIEKGEVK